jgi:hypothetical protein
MDRRIIIAAVIALTLATFAKLAVPGGTAASTEMAKMTHPLADELTSQFIQVDPMWLVGP